MSADKSHEADAEALLEREQAHRKAAERARSAAEIEELKNVAPEPGVAKPDSILTADNVSRRFGGLQAVSVDHLEVQRGTITALIGPNGAGKTTFFNLVSGFDVPNTGKWSFDGHSLTRQPAYRIARRGLVRTFQLTKALMRLTARENMMLGATDQRGERLLPSLVRPLWRTQEKEIGERADELLERFGLTRMRDEFAGTMSGGQRKLLEMARALMVEPSMLMLDEPMAGVNPALTESLLSHIRDLRDDGMTIILVEHDMDVVMGVSDWVVCFASGEIIAEGTPESISSNDAVIDAYLGTSRATGSDDSQTEEA